MAILPMGRTRGRKIQSGLTRQGQARCNHYCYLSNHLPYDPHNWWPTECDLQLLNGRGQRRSQGSLTNGADHWHTGWTEMGPAEWISLVDPVLRQDLACRCSTSKVHSALGEGRTFVIGPIKATLNRYMHIYILCLDAQKSMCIYIHIRQKGWNVVCLTTQLPHSTSPPPPITISLTFSSHQSQPQTKDVN